MIHQIVSASAIGLNAARDRIFPGQNWVISENIDIPQFSNLTSTTTILLFKFNLRWQRVLWLLQKRGNPFLFIQSYQRTLKRKHPELQWAVRKILFTRFEKYLKDIKHNSLYFARKLVQIFVLGHYNFHEAHSFPRVRKTVRILEQIISADKSPFKFLRQSEALVNIHIHINFQIKNYKQFYAAQKILRKL